MRGLRYKWMTNVKSSAQCHHAGRANVCSYLCGLGGFISCSCTGIQRTLVQYNPTKDSKGVLIWMSKCSCSARFRTVPMASFVSCFILTSRAAQLRAKHVSIVAQQVCPRSRSARVYGHPCRSASLSVILSMFPRATYQDRKTLTTHSVVFQVLLGIRCWIASLIAFRDIDGPICSLFSALAHQLIESFSII